MKISSYAQYTMLIALGLVAAVLGLFLLGKTGIIPNDPQWILDWIKANAESPAGFITLIIVFCVGAFIAMPQYALIAGAIWVYGSLIGVGASWLAILVSGSVTFWVGRWVGAESIQKYGGNLVNQVSMFIGDNAFLASLVARNVPAGPFIIINMVFGASRAKFFLYFFGMAVGIIPKIVLVALAGQSLSFAQAGSPELALLAASGAVIVALLIYARKKMKKTKKTDQILPISSRAGLSNSATSQKIKG